MPGEIALSVRQNGVTSKYDKTDLHWERHCTKLMLHEEKFNLETHVYEETCVYDEGRKETTTSILEDENVRMYRCNASSPAFLETVSVNTREPKAHPSKGPSCG